VDPVAKQVEGCWRWGACLPACLPLGRYEHMNQKDGAWIEDGVETGWLERSARATNSRCWLLAVCCLLHHHRQSVLQNLL